MKIPSNIWTLPTIAEKPNPPDAGGTREAFSRIGYKLEEAIADIADNSIDANAKNILIRFVQTDKAINRVVIADDGHGMSHETIIKAMQFGARTNHKKNDLGKYGIGMKSASFSQGDTMIVASRENRKTYGMRWTDASIKNGWLCEEINPEATAKLIDLDWAGLSLSESGTLVIWEDLDYLGHSESNPDITREKAVQKISGHLGLVFHRFIENGLTIKIDAIIEGKDTAGLATSVVPMNPFGYPHSGHRKFPKVFAIEFEDLGKLDLEAHIWPQKSKDPGYKLGGGKVAERQGFYFYRNDRVIQAGGWNRLRESDAEPHFSLARVKVDLPSSFDGAFSLNVQKSEVDVPSPFPGKALASKSGSTSFRDYLGFAEKTYRTRVISKEDFPLVMGSGIPPSVRKKCQRALGDGGKRYREVTFKWLDLPEGVFFKLTHDNNELILNKKFRNLLLSGAKGSLNDLPLIKSLLFLLLRDDFDRKAISQKHRNWIKAINQIIIAALKKEYT